MGWFSDLFSMNNIKSFYNTAKETISNVYHPIKSIVNTVANGVRDIDSFISKGKEIPLVRDLVGMIQGNPLYSEALSITRDVQDSVNAAGEIGAAIDDAVSGALG